MSWNSVRGYVLAAVTVGAAMLLFAPASYALGLPPVNTTFPAITGTAQAGQTLTCSSGSWTESLGGTGLTYAYSWQRDVTTTIGSATNMYTLTAADVGHAITCEVVATDSNGTNPVPAVSVPPIVPIAAPPVPPVNTAPPMITGTAQGGQALTCSSGTWMFSGTPPDTYAYTWQRTGSNIAGQTSSQYTLTTADVNQVITCEVVASDSNGSSPLPGISLPVIPVAATSGGTGGTGGKGGGTGGGTGGKGGGTGGTGRQGAARAVARSRTRRRSRRSRLLPAS